MRTLIVILFALIFVPSATAQHVEYYGDFPFWESPVQMFKGQNPLSKRQANERQHVRAEFDQNGRLVDVQMRLGDRLKEPAAFFRSLHFHVEHTQISYEGNQAVQRFFNRFGTRVSVWGNVWEKVYTFDEHGRPVRMDFLGRDGAPVENSWGSAYFTWQHNADGSIIEERYSLAGELMPHRAGFEFKRIRMTFAPDGHLALMQNIDEDGKLIGSQSGAAQYRYFYDAAGMFLRWEVYDAKGQPALGPTGTAGEQYKNGANGFQEIAFFDKAAERSLHGSGAAYWRGRYDRFGNIIELAFYGVNDEPVIGRSGFHRHLYSWSADGLYLVQRDYVGLDDAPANSIDGFSRAVYVRNSRGLLIEVRFFDASGQPVINTYENAAILRYDYDAGGVRTTTRKLDPTGAPMPPEGP